MAHYLVKARPIPEKMEELRARIARGEIVKMIPFGRGLHNSLSDARLDSRGWALWEELDFCRPPLKIEREAVLDEYFDTFKVEPVEQGEGWAQIRTLPRLLHSEIPIPARNGTARKTGKRATSRKKTPRKPPEG